MFFLSEILSDQCSQDFTCVPHNHCFPFVSVLRLWGGTNVESFSTQRQSELNLN